jgi:hypothetical protein
MKGTGGWMIPRVTLVNWTPNPIEYMYQRWHGSRTDGKTLSVNDVQLIQERCVDEPGLKYLQQYRPDLFTAFKKFGEPRKLFKYLLDEEVPVVEPVVFDFQFDNITVAFREQLVRHDEGFFSPTLWSQTSRARDAIVDKKLHLREFIAKPRSVSRDPKASAIWDLHVETVNETFKSLIDLGIPQDDARGVLPMQYTHRISAAFLLRDLKRIMAKRSCWIAQNNLWAPILKGMTEELVLKVDPIFEGMMDPPCVKNDEFAYCPIQVDNKHRLDGEDPVAPCPIWLHQDYAKKHLRDSESSEEWVRIHQKDHTYQNMTSMRWMKDTFGEYWRPLVRRLMDA